MSVFARACERESEREEGKERKDKKPIFLAQTNPEKCHAKICVRCVIGVLLFGTEFSYANNEYVRAFRSIRFPSNRNAMASETRGKEETHFRFTRYLKPKGDLNIVINVQRIELSVCLVWFFSPPFCIAPRPDRTVCA